MTWRPDQIDRLKLELMILQGKWPGWTVNDTGSTMHVTRVMRTNRKRSYKVKLLVTSRYPDEEPELYVVSPKPKVKPSKHEDHTLSRNSYGQRICGYANWEPNDTLLQAALRLREWLEAYDATRNAGLLRSLLGGNNSTIASILD